MQHSAHRQEQQVTDAACMFLQVCRIVPWTVTNYKLDELITARDLRRNIAEQFQKHAKVTNPQVHYAASVYKLL